MRNLDPFQGMDYTVGAIPLLPHSLNDLSNKNM